MKVNFPNLLKDINKNSTANIIFNGIRANAFPLNIELKTRMSNLRTSTQYYSEDLSQYNKAKKEKERKKRHTNWKGRNISGLYQRIISGLSNYFSIFPCR